jgi:hypothetical protein
VKPVGLVNALLAVHGISNPDGVVFALAGTAVNAAMILCVLPVRALLKRRT